MLTRDGQGALKYLDGMMDCGLRGDYGPLFKGGIVVGISEQKSHIGKTWE